MLPRRSRTADLAFQKIQELLVQGLSSLQGPRSIFAIGGLNKMPRALNCVHNGDDHRLLVFKSAVQYMKHFIYHFTVIFQLNKNFFQNYWGGFSLPSPPGSAVPALSILGDQLVKDLQTGKSTTVRQVLEQVMDSIVLVANAKYKLNMKRRELIMPDLNPLIHGYAKRTSSPLQSYLGMSYQNTSRI